MLSTSWSPIRRAFKHEPGAPYFAHEMPSGYTHSGEPWAHVDRHRAMRHALETGLMPRQFASTVGARERVSIPGLSPLPLPTFPRREPVRLEAQGQGRVDSQWDRESRRFAEQADRVARQWRQFLTRLDEMTDEERARTAGYEAGIDRPIKAGSSFDGK